MDHIQITAQAVAEAVAIERQKSAAEIERLPAALRVIADLPPGSQRAYGKFAEAQQIAKRELGTLRQSGNREG